MIVKSKKCAKENIIDCTSILDISGNPVTETIQSAVVTDATGNPVTGKFQTLVFYTKEKYILVKDTFLRIKCFLGFDLSKKY